MLRFEENKMCIKYIKTHYYSAFNGRVLILLVVHVTYTIDFIRINFQYWQCIYRNTVNI